MAPKRRGLSASVSPISRPGSAPNRTSGLVSAIRTSETATEPLDDPSSTRMLLVPLSSITGHPDNPREELRDIPELADSVAEFGLIQPPVVIPVDAFTNNYPQHAKAVAGKDWVIVAGHRRHAAAEMAGLDEIYVIVRPDMKTREAPGIAFILENVHRDDLQPLEEGQATPFWSTWA